MNRLKQAIVGVSLLISSSGFSQDTISIMYYNLLNFPLVNSGRITYLNTVLQHVKPDILVVEELTSSGGSSNILNNALNTGGTTYYAAANYVDGPDTENMLYYNTNKLGYISQNEIPTTLRDINEYVLYYKNPTLTAASDTAYLYVYGAHLKAGSSVSNESDRATETSILKSYLNTRPFAENTIVGGDFNIYYSTEAAYNNLTGSSQANLYDPIGAGSYHNNSSYTLQFTQSTRVDAFDGGSTGGMDDRFDYILFSDDIVTGDNGVRFINSSYHPIGQDGQRWNSSLIIPTNNSEPSNVINALYYMSDHLPIYMEVEVGGDLGITEKAASVNIYPNPADDNLTLTASDVIGAYTLCDLQGRVVLKGEMNQMSGKLDLANVAPGTYYLSFELGSTVVTKHIAVR